MLCLKKDKKVCHLRSHFGQMAAFHVVLQSPVSVSLQLAERQCSHNVLPPPAGLFTP